MTTRPRLHTGSKARGLAAVALFGAMAAAFARARFGSAAGFPEGANITASIGYAMFDLDLGAVPAESFLVAFIVMAVALDVAIDGAVHLATREGEGDGGARADGGPATAGRDRGGED